MDLVPIPVENFGHALRCQIIVKVVVHLDGRSPAAGADAFYFFEREDAVGGHALVPDAKLFLEFLVDLVSATQHATDIGADLHVEFACRFEAQHRVVGGHIADIEFGDADALRHFGDHCVG